MNNSLSAYVITDDAGRVHNTDEALRDGIPYRLLIEEETQYCYINILLTGLPIVTVHTKEILDDQGVESNVMIQEKTENGLIAAVDESGIIKESKSGEVVTIKAFDNSTPNLAELFEELKETGIDEWKLYKIDKNDLFRMKLAFEIWNLSCSDSIVNDIINFRLQRV